MARDDVLDEVLLSGLDDWVMLAQVEAMIQRHDTTAARDALVDKVADAIGELLAAGLVQVGDVDGSAGFLPWELNDAVARIRFEWQRLDRNLAMGDICWLSNTARGDERAVLVRNE